MKLVDIIEYLRDSAKVDRLYDTLNLSKDSGGDFDLHEGHFGSRL